jgi:hypothetical protein
MTMAFGTGHTGCRKRKPNWKSTIDFYSKRAKKPTIRSDVATSISRRAFAGKRK